MQDRIQEIKQLITSIEDAGQYDFVSEADNNAYNQYLAELNAELSTLEKAQAATHPLFDANVTQLVDLFETAGFQIRVVGGAVRDWLLGETPKDVDLCTDATPDEMIQLGNAGNCNWIAPGYDHGTVTFIVNKLPYEITTLRVDVETDGRHAVVDYTRDFQQDAQRRDLTVNAMSVDREGNLFDYFGGQQDLEDRVMRFVGSAEQRIREDYLRILRYFRFTARFEAGWDSEALAAMSQSWAHEGLTRISVERVWAEMSKLLVSPGAEDVMAEMFTCGVAQAIGLERTTRWQDRMQHADDAVSALTGLTHDGAALGRRWRMSSQDTRKLEYLVNNEYRVDVAAVDNMGGWMVWAEDELVMGRPRDWVISQMQLFAYGDAEVVQHAETFQIPTMPVSGSMLLAHGVPEGKAMGQLLADMKRAWMHSRFTMTAEDLMRMAP